jgi:hypothetical protein
MVRRCTYSVADTHPPPPIGSSRQAAHYEPTWAPLPARLTVRSSATDRRVVEDVEGCLWEPTRMTLRSPGAPVFTHTADELSPASPLGRLSASLRERARSTLDTLRYDLRTGSHGIPGPGVGQGHEPSPRSGPEA